MTVVVTIPMALPSAGNLHEHWRKRHARIKAQRAATLLALKPTFLREDLVWVTWGTGVGVRRVLTNGPTGRLVVTFTRVSPRKLDDDNLAFAFKGIRDEVAAYFGVNDNDPRIEWRYAQAKGPAKVVIAFEVEALAAVGAT